MPVITWKLSSLSAAGKPDLLLLPLESRSLDDASLQLPGGAYTTFRTFASRKVLHLQDHLARLEQTAALSGQPIHLDRAALRRALRQTITSPAPEADDWRIRLTLDLEDRPGDIYICLQPLETPPSEAYESGVLVTTIDLQRQLPKAKLTRFIARAGDVRQHLPAGVNEALMVDPRGCLLEGLSSNFFAVRAGLLYTAEEGVLSGITRSLVLQATAGCNISLRLEPVRLADLPALDEAFLTSTSRGVLPISEIDQVHIGQTCPGPFTHRLMIAYQTLVAQQVEEI
jgi:branched-chain amino acid aminotransferase